MPWLLNAGVADSRELSWSRVLNTDGTTPLPPMWHRPDVVPAAEFWPLPFRQASNHPNVPDFCRGWGQGSLFVSKAFKTLVESKEPVTHHFVPLRLELHDGTVSEGAHFLFKFGNFVDGIITEKSEVGAMHDDTGKLGFYSTGPSPQITWQREAIENRHFWADTYLRNRPFCSDAFLEEMERQEMGVFDKIKSFVDD